MAEGSLIPIEERPHDEMRRIGDIQLAPSGINCWNPGFDVTPAQLITRIVTERGCFETQNLHVLK